MNIGEYNRQVTVKRWGSVQNVGGGSAKVLLDSWTVWAKMEDRTGSLSNAEGQRQWSYDTVITIRLNPSKLLMSKDTIDYENYRYVINSLRTVKEGRKDLHEIRCSKSDTQIDDSGIAGIVGTYDYFGVGGESSFTANGSGMTAPNTNRDLRGKTLYGTYKDGIQFQFLYTGAPDPLVKQVVYNAASGLFTWSVPFETGETAFIQYY